MTISARIIADSISDAGIRITTMELEYPRFIHAEFMTHRVFSRNAASSRAIPVAKAIDLIKTNTAMPIHWGKNQPGMSAKEECDVSIELSQPEGSEFFIREDAWCVGRDYAIEVAEAFNDAGYHKQIVNRLLEPFTHIKVIVTATEWDNFYALRLHPDAQPEIQELARCMKEAQDNSLPTRLEPGDWHVPYYKNGQWKASGYFEIGQFDMTEFDDKRSGSSLQDALAISASCCAQVSYRALDDTLEKAQKIYQRLIAAEPMHASPFEHQASPIRCKNLDVKDYYQDEGFTHRDINGFPWSGNFRGWIQYRQIL